MEVAAKMNASDIERGLDRIAFEHRSGFRQMMAGPNLIGRATIMQPHRTLRVVPLPENIQPALDPVFLSGEQGHSLPEAECSEKTLDLPVELLGVVSLAFDYFYAKRFLFERSFEFAAELTAVISDNESRFAEVLHACFHESHHIPRRGRIFIDFQGKKFPRESINNGGDVKTNKEQVDRSKVKMPGLVDGFRAQNVMRCDFRRRRSGLSRFARLPRLLLAQDALNGRAANLSAKAKDLHRNGASTEILFRAELANLVNKPAARFGNFVDGRGEKTARFSRCVHFSQPGAQRVLMNAKARGGRKDNGRVLIARDVAHNFNRLRIVSKSLCGSKTTAFSESRGCSPSIELIRN
jgi:hypothetical protein